LQLVGWGCNQLLEEELGHAIPIPCFFYPNRELIDLFLEYLDLNKSEEARNILEM
jgi:hypothetical protein